MSDPALRTEESSWFVYLLLCHNNHYYCGIAKDVQARFEAHKAGKGAKYTRSNPPLCIVAQRAYPDRATASRAEYAIKKLPRDKKLAALSFS
ncbi:MAG: GIY-YIG nuclease family protein [Hahellaceae bacterium]|nr:GIY-YIG nuclease family protein [Hahellaceae bacterium]